MGIREAHPATGDHRARARHHRWIENAGAQLLVVDPTADGGALALAMGGRGVHVTWAESAHDGLVEFGRTEPHAVLVAADDAGLDASAFIAVVRRHGAPFVIAGVADQARVGGPDVAPAILAGAGAIASRPYRADQVWDLLVHGPRPVAEHTRLSVGPVELDAAAYSVWVGGQRVVPDLPLKEFELLRALMLRAPDVVSDEDLRVALWGDSGRRPRSNTIAMHATRLRARLGPAVEVRRVRGRGYSLVPTTP